jgi:PAS domain S-box-containing protein
MMAERNFPTSRNQDASNQVAGPTTDGSGKHKSVYHLVVEDLPVWLACKDLAGRFTVVSKLYARNHGTTPGEMRGKSDFDYYPEELARKFRLEDLEVIESGQPFVSVERSAIDNTQYFEVHKGPIHDNDGSILGVQTIFLDVSDRARAEKLLSDERDMLQTIMDHLPDFIYVKNFDGQYVVVNNAVRKILRANKIADVIGKTNFDFLPYDQAREEQQDDQRVMSTGQPLIEREECLRDLHGNDLWILTSKVPLKNTDGKITGLVGIDRDITHLKLTQDKLRAAKETADEANQAKGDFLANMSHEIRTPLNAIIGMTDLLLETHLSKSQREYLGMVQSSGESLLSLINDILDFSKIEAGKFELDVATFDIRDCLGDVMKTLGLRAYEKGIELAVNIDNSIPRYLKGDAGRIQQIVINLVGNAIKFTESGEVVLDIICDAQDGRQATLHATVSDTGIGIAQEKCDRIFDEFEQADASTTRRFGGTGLGLAISSRLVEMMHGRIWVESELGRGSKFQFTITLDVDQQKIGEPHLHQLVDVSGLRVLVVDDNATNRRILQDMLTNWGMAPVTATGAKQALQLLQQARQERDPIQIVISDVNMPDMDGITLAATIREHQLLEMLSIIMLTSGARPDDANRLRELGVTHHLMKPVKQSELFSTMVSTLDESSSFAELAAKSGTRDKQVQQTRPLKILLAEDNSVNQKLALGILGNLGHQVIVANNGVEAVALLNDDHFDLVLMDVQMPEMDGLVATRIIRENEQAAGGHIPIVAMTAHAMKGDREQCLEAGMDDYLAKPIRPHDLSRKLGELFPAFGGAADSRKIFGDHSESVESAKPNLEIGWESVLRNLGGNESLLKEVIFEFLQDTPRLLANAERAAASGDADTLKRSAHSLRGSLLFLNVDRVSEVIGNVETLASQGQLAQSQAALADFKSGFEQVVKSLQRFVDR